METAFSGGDISSNGSVMLLRQANRALGLTEQASCRHTALSIIQQRVYGTARAISGLSVSLILWISVRPEKHAFSTVYSFVGIGNI